MLAFDDGESHPPSAGLRWSKIARRDFNRRSGEVRDLGAARDDCASRELHLRPAELTFSVAAVSARRTSVVGTLRCDVRGRGSVASLPIMRRFETAATTARPFFREPSYAPRDLEAPNPETAYCVMRFETFRPSLSIRDPDRSA